MDLDTLCRANKMADGIRHFEQELNVARHLRERSDVLTISSRGLGEISFSDSRIINDVLILIEEFCTNKINELKVDFEKL